MDFIFHSHMNQQQVYEFGDRSMQKERNAEAYLQKYNQVYCQSNFTLLKK